MESLGGLLAIGVVAGAVLLAVLVILLPFSAYSAQKWAYRCYQELVKLNRKLDSTASRPPQTPESAEPAAGVTGLGLRSRSRRSEENQ